MIDGNPGSTVCKKRMGFDFIAGYRTLVIWQKWFGKTRGGVLVLDDLMEEGGQDKRVLDLFTKDSHHCNITVLNLTQDLFPPGKFCKTINRNAHYIVAFKNPLDQRGIRTILLQAFPWYSSWMMNMPQYMGPGTHLEKQLARSDPGINRLDRVVKARHQLCQSQGLEGQMGCRSQDDYEDR